MAGRSLVNQIPSGNVDVAPTILWLLGVKAPATMDGRVLHEALVHSKTHTSAPEVKTIEAKCDVDLFHWEQYLKFSTVGTTRYFDESNGLA